MKDERSVKGKCYWYFTSHKTNVEKSDNLCSMNCSIHESVIGLYFTSYLMSLHRISRFIIKLQK